MLAPPAYSARGLKASVSALGDYLAEAGRRPWNHGDKPGPKHDCCTFISDWCIACGYPDPMAFIRGDYTTEAEANELVRSKGLQRLVARGFRDIGLKRTRAPQSGDVGVLRRLTVDGANVVCAIRSGERWVTLIERGLIVDPGGDLVRAWRVQWEKR
jgi:hypothetical protein